MLDLIFAILIGVIGGCIANKCKVPAGYMIGSLIAVAMYNICFKEVDIPTYFKFGTQIATGIFLGTKFYKKDLVSLKLVLLPGFFMVFFMIVFSLIISYIISYFFDLEYVTAVFSISPGGLMDMSLLAYEFKANTSQVALLQLVRLISVILFIPFITRKIYARINKEENKSRIKRIKKIENNELIPKNIGKYELILNFFRTILIGLIGGFLGYKFKIPAGAMSLSMVFVAIFNLQTSRAYMPLTLRKFIQTVGGALIGSRVSITDVMGVKDLFLPIVIIIGSFILMDIIIGYVLYKTTKFSLMTSLLSAAPGGMSDIALMAEDLGANANEVTMMQFLRASCIIGIYPIIIKFIFS